MCKKTWNIEGKDKYMSNSLTIKPIVAMKLGNS